MTRQVVRGAMLALAVVLVTAACGNESTTGSTTKESVAVHDDSVKTTLPDGESLLLRTDFSDESGWRQILGEVNKPYDETDIEYGLTVVDNPDFKGLTTAEVGERLTSQYYVYVVDTQTMRNPEHPILVVDHSRHDQPGEELATFRVVPREVYMVEVNLTLANSDFEDFVDAADEDGVYRGDGN